MEDSGTGVLDWASPFLHFLLSLSNLLNSGAAAETTRKCKKKELDVQLLELLFSMGSADFTG